MSDLTPQWSWQFTDRGGRDLDRPLSPVFAIRYDAEEWLGGHWRVLRDQGVATVVLRHAGSTVPPQYDLTAVPEQMTFHPVSD